MCASCKCGCKPGKPAKGCDCQCKECRAARESVSKSGILVRVEKMNKYRAVNDAGMLPGAIGGSVLGAYAARSRRPAVMLGSTIAGSLAGGAAGSAATYRLRRKMARKDRERAAVGKSDRAARQRKTAATIAAIPYANYAAPFYAASQSKKGRKLAVGGRTIGRMAAESAAFGAPGIALTLLSRGRSRALTNAGRVYGAVGGMVGSSHGAYRAVGNAQRRGDIPVGKSLAELGGVAKAAPFGSLSNPFKGIGALKPVGGSVKRRVANNAAAASVARKPRFKDSSVSPFKDMSNPLRRIS